MKIFSTLWPKLKGTIAYDLIMTHEKNCILAHQETQTCLTKLENKINCISNKVDDLIGIVKNFIEMRPDLQESINERRNRKIIITFIGMISKIISGTIVAVAALVAMSFALAPFIKELITKFR